MKKYLYVSEIVSLYDTAFYRKLSKNIPAIIHPILRLKMFEKDAIDVYRKTYLENQKVTIKDLCKNLKISREWFYQLVKKGTIPQPIKKESGRNWGYLRKNINSLVESYLKEKNKS